MRAPAFHMPSQNLVVLLLTGLALGLVAGKFIQRHGLGMIGDALAGMIGAYIGAWALPRLGLHYGSGLVRPVLNGAMGAAGSLSFVRFIRWI